METGRDFADADRGGTIELNLGVKLRSAREAQKLSLDDVAAELRIGVPALRALEECRFEALGPPVFAKGYLKQYGARLGLDVQALLADYERMAGTAAVEIAPSKTIRLRDEHQISSWIVAGLILMSVAALLSVWWLRQPGQLWGPEATLPEPGPLRPAAAEPETRPVPAAAGPADSEARAVLPPDPAPPSTAIESEAAAERGRAAAESGGAAAGPGVPSAEPVVDRPSIEVVFVEDSWTEITSAAGERLYYQLGRAGATVRLPADDSLRFFFGNARGVEIRLDGEPVAIPASARRGDLAQFELGDLRD